MTRTGIDRVGPLRSVLPWKSRGTAVQRKSFWWLCWSNGAVTLLRKRGKHESETPPTPILIYIQFVPPPKTPETSVGILNCEQALMEPCCTCNERCINRNRIAW